jgi:hypothetical protein
MKFNTLPRIFLEEYDILNPPVPSLPVLNIAMPLFCSVLVVTMLLSLWSGYTELDFFIVLVH